MARQYRFTTTGDALLLNGTGSGTQEITASSGGGTTNRLYIAPDDDPGTSGFNTGTFTCVLNVSSAGSNTTATLSIRRYNSSDVQQATVNASQGAVSTATTGDKTFTWTNPALGTWAAGDYVAINILITNNNAHGGAAGPTFDFAATNTRLDTPFVAPQGRGFGQAQAHIKAIVRGFGQAQAQILAVVSRYAQATARIKNTYNGLGQSNARTPAVVEILDGQTSPGSTSIVLTYNNLQADDILISWSVVGLGADMNFSYNTTSAIPIGSYFVENSKRLEVSIFTVPLNTSSVEVTISRSGTASTFVAKGASFRARGNKIYLLDTSVTNTGTSNAPNTGSITWVLGQELYFGAVGTAHPGTALTAGNGFLTLTHITGANESAIAEYNDFITNTTDITFNHNVSIDFAAIGLAFRTYEHQRSYAQAQAQIKQTYSASGQSLAKIAAYHEEVLKDNPLFYLRLDETTGTTAQDATANDVDGTFTGSPLPAINQDPLLGTDDGRSVIFTEASDPFGTPVGRILVEPYTSTHTSWSVEFLVAVSALPTVNNLYISTVSGNPSSPWEERINIGHEANGNIQIWNGSIWTAVSSLIVDGPHHFVFTYNGTNLIVYKDGSEVYNDSWAGNSLTIDDVFTLGTNQNGFAGWGGTLDEVAVYGSVLSSDRVTAHFNAAKLGISPTVRAHAQSNAQIKNTYNAHAQAQAQIKQIYNAHAQAQAQIKQIYSVHAQAEAWIETTYSAHAQAQGTILRTYEVHAQAQGTILQTYNQHAQAQGSVLQIYNAHAQAQALIINTYNVHAQAQSAILQVYHGHAQAGARIKGDGALVWVYDTFTRVVVDGFDTPDIGPTYEYAQEGQVSINGSVGSIDSGSKVILSPIAAYNLDTQIDFKFIDIGKTTVYVEIGGRADKDLNAWIGAFIQGLNDDNYLGIFSTNTTQDLLQVNLDFDIWYTLKLRIKDNKSYAKVWIKGNIEPDWMLQHIVDTPDSVAGAYIDLAIASTNNDTEIDNYHVTEILDLHPAQSQAQIKQTYTQYAQAQAWIKQTYYVHAQSQAQIINTYTVHAQAQSTILRTYEVHGQSQAQIKQTYNEHAQAQAQILQVYTVHAQAQALITNTYFGLAQAQGTILQTYFAVAQAQAQILTTYYVFGQAQALILQTYYAHAQAQAQILNTYFGLAQAQGTILTTYFSHAQAQAKINAFGVNQHSQAQALVAGETVVFGQAQAKINAFDVNAHGQSQAWIEQTYNSHAQAQAQIKQTYEQFAQAQAQILQTYVQHGQAQGQILQTYFAHAQAEAWTLNTYNAHGQAQAQIKQTYVVHAQAQGKINAFDVCEFGQAQALIGGVAVVFAQAQAKINAFDVNVHGQAAGWIENTYNEFAQSQSTILQTYYAHGQANAQIVNTYFGHSQAQATILAQGYGHGQSQGQIKTTYNQHGQVQGQIRQTYYGHAQAEGYIVATYQGYGQAQGTILATTNVYAQSQASILQSYTQHANAQGWIETTVNSHGQAQGQIRNTYYGHGQSEAYILNGINTHAQAQAYILIIHYEFGQSQAFIQKSAGYGQAQAFIRQDRIIKNLTVKDRKSIVLSLSDREQVDIVLNLSDRNIKLTLRDSNY